MAPSERRNVPHIGWREWVVLPGLNSVRLKAKVDTGARTSALHAFGLECFERDGQDWVRFAIHPHQRDDSYEILVEYPVSEYRMVRSSNGQQSRRPVITTLVAVGRYVWATEITLADRDAMGFRMLLGRHAIRGRFLVDSGRSFLHARRRSTSS